jgi:integrase
MPRRPSIPRYCLHKRSGQAVVFINRTQRYLGPYDSPESRAAYGEIVAQLSKNGAVDAAKSPQAPVNLTVSALLLKYVTEELPRFSADEQHCQRGAIRIVRQLFGETSVIDFGPLKLRLVREAMITGDPAAVDAEGKPSPRKPWSRDYINHQIKRLRSVFRWGVSWEIVPQTVADALAAVSALKVGETTAVDYEVRESVPDADIKAVRSLLKPRDQDILDLLLLTGARPGELIGLKVGDVERNGETWRCELVKHKTAHKGKKRVLLFNRHAQAILMRHIKADPSVRFFVTTRSTFSNTIKKKCLAAGVTPWVPHQLRHTVGTLLADELGLEASQRVLGHSKTVMTEHYARAAEKKAREAVERLGGQ